MVELNQFQGVLLKFKTLLATSICFLVLGIAAAQSCTVRVAYNTNLRTSSAKTRCRSISSDC